MAKRASTKTKPKAAPRTRRKARPDDPEPVLQFQDAVASGDDWFEALLDAIAAWELTEETVRGRHYRYLIGGEAFDWLLLAERLCESSNGAIPVAEREALLFHGRLPHSMEEEDLRRAMGDAKHRAHLNYVYGVTVEEALQLTIEEEVLKEGRSSVWNRNDVVEAQVFDRIYGRSREDLLDQFRSERELPEADEIAYADLRAFIYWLFKYRVNQSDPARVASDTRKALAQVSRLEQAARRRAEALGTSGQQNAFIIDGEVVAHVR